VWEWPFIFYTLAAYGALNSLLIWLLLHETLPHKHAFRPKVIAANYRELAVHPQFLALAAGASLNYAALMIFLPSSPFVFITLLGLNPEYLAFIFVGTVSGYIAGSALSARLSHRLASERIAILGATLSLTGSLGMLAGHALFPASVLGIALPMIVYSTSLGLVQPHTMALALKPFGHIAGTGSSLFGFIQMTMSAAASAVVGLFLTDSAWPMLLGMGAATSSGLIVLLTTVKRTPQI
jgi:DHA1 family bicyclomycin/chloramphenicol resistance-like MFS transporter